MKIKILTSFFIFTSFIIAQNFDGLRIYINPGHGGRDGDDRYIAATGFWESEGNLGKGKHLNSILKSFGAVTEMSRTTNFTQDDLPLSTITERANAFDADYFHSIHSNGGGGGANYTLMLWEGSDTNPTYPDAKVIGAYMADEIFKAHRTEAKFNRGEVSFYGGAYLGLFAGRLSMPGVLSEGSFHDYIPESWRLRNDAYLKHEAWALAKALIKFYELTPLPYGEIAGILRDPFTNVDYYANQQDQKKPLNLVKATLLPNNKLFLGDALNNGFFLFDKVMPGEYQIELEADGTAKDTISVEVFAGETTFADRFLFAPNQRKKLSLQKHYPAKNEQNVSSTVKIKIQYDYALDINSLGGNVFFQDEFGKDIVLKNFDEEDYENGWIIFESNEPLKNGVKYTVKILKNIKDINGLSPDTDLTINFYVEPEQLVDGEQLLNFDELEQFTNPLDNSLTTGIDTENTNLSLSTQRFFEGTGSTKLTYSFLEDSLGICPLELVSPISVSNPNDEKFGIWVFGDFSSNILEYWFSDSEDNIVPIIADTLNWTGWKFVEVDLTFYTQISKFNTIVLKQNVNAEKQGQIYFDDMLKNSIITDLNLTEEVYPKVIVLSQNYPNPFNPTTQISYSLPIVASSFSLRKVTLKVYDVLGKVVQTLVDKDQQSGQYDLNFDATSLPSGVYYYQLKAGDFVETKKMLLLK